MAWTTPKTWTAALVSVAELNTHIRDNLNAISSIPRARVYHTASQLIADATLTALPFNTERYDTDTIHDNATNNSRLTATTAGTYLISGTVEWAANATGYRSVAIRLNGTTEIDGSMFSPVTGSHVVLQSVTTLYNLAATNYVELVVQQTSGDELNVTATVARSPEFMMQRLSD